mmetsp:Transcript_58830/g.164280  ORF Transcript_58830/g.164280 Transcript_58830/m.164280 type:complete len:254 (+) Transcript_58830:84-845(+)
MGNCSRSVCPLRHAASAFGGSCCTSRFSGGSFPSEVALASAECLLITFLLLGLLPGALGAGRLLRLDVLHAMLGASVLAFHFDFLFSLVLDLGLHVLLRLGRLHPVLRQLLARRRLLPDLLAATARGEASVQEMPVHVGKAGPMLHLFGGLLRIAAVLLLELILELLAAPQLLLEAARHERLAVLVLVLVLLQQAVLYDLLLHAPTVGCDDHLLHVLSLASRARAYSVRSFANGEADALLLHQRCSAHRLRAA